MVKKPLQFLSYIIIAFLLLACNNTQSDKKKNKQLARHISAKANKYITMRCAVFIRPTIHQIDSMKSRPDSNDFYIGADDYIYYMYTTRKFLDSVKLKQIVRDSQGAILFKSNTGQVFKMDLNDLRWAVILFNGKAKPIIADITDITGDYKTYMNE